MRPCPRCFLDDGLCLCAEIPRVETRTAFLILRHVNEARRRTNSGRIAALAMPKCEIVDNRERRDMTGFEPPPGSWLLFPGGDTAAKDAAPPATVIVLDGTWREAKRLFLRTPALHRLPRVPILPAAPADHLRRPPPGGLATLEAIACAVQSLDGDAPARALHELFALFVKRSLEGARRAGRRLLR